MSCGVKTMQETQTSAVTWDGLVRSEHLRILLAIVHHWNPHGDGAHQSLRPDLEPKLWALQDQLLCLRRFGVFQGTLNIANQQVEPVNQATAHVIDIAIVTDGEHHVLDHLEAPYKSLFEHVVVEPKTSKHLGFEAQKLLVSRLDQTYDLYGYFEDDLLIADPFFFRKIDWFRRQLNDRAVLLPHRYESHRLPDRIDKLYVDGPVSAVVLCSIRCTCLAALAVKLFQAPAIHAGCFVLALSNCSTGVNSLGFRILIVDLSALESSTSLDCSRLWVYKPALVANWLELQHWGRSFRMLVAEC